MRIGVYPGTFDPITRGHTDIIARGLHLFDQLIVAVAPNPLKKPWLPIADRIELAQIATHEFAHVEVKSLNGLLVEYVRQSGAQAIIRGLRAVSDFDHECQMARLNRKLDEQVETVFLMPREDYSYLTSNIVKELAMCGGPLEDFVHPEVANKLQHWSRKHAS